MCTAGKDTDDPKHIYGRDLVNEIKSVGKVLPEKQTHIESLSLLHNLEYYPNLCIALRIC